MEGGAIALPNVFLAIQEEHKYDDVEGKRPGAPIKRPRIIPKNFQLALIENL